MKICLYRLIPWGVLTLPCVRTHLPFPIAPWGRAIVRTIGGYYDTLLSWGCLYPCSLLLTPDGMGRVGKSAWLLQTAFLVTGWLTGKRRLAATGQSPTSAQWSRLVASAIRGTWWAAGFCDAWIIQMLILLSTAEWILKRTQMWSMRQDADGVSTSENASHGLQTMCSSE